MMQKIYSTTLIVAWTGVLLCGCGTAPHSGAVSSRSGDKSAPAKANGRSEPDETVEQRRIKAYAHFAAGVSSELNDAQDAALEHYVASAAADPGHEVLVLEVVGRLLQRKQPDRAIGLLIKSTAPPDASGKMFAWLAMAYAETGKNEQAIQANREALRRDPDLLMAYRNLSQIYAESRQPEEALKVLDEAAARSASEPSFWIDLAELYLNYSRLHPAESEAIKPRIVTVLNRAAELKPQNLLLVQRLADGLKLMGEFSTAERFYQELLDRFPALPGLREKLAEIYLREGKKSEAVKQLEAIIRNNPRNEQAHYLLGSIAYEEKKLTEAEDYFEKALLLRPEFEPVYYDLAGLKIARNKSREALELLEKARARFKPNFFLEFYTAMAHSRSKEYDTAMKHLTEAEVIARASEPQRLNHNFYYRVGEVLERKGDYSAAEKAFRKCLELSPNFAEAMNYLGYMWADRGENLEEAKKLIEKAVELEPKNAAFLDSLGWVLFKLNQPKEALDWLLKAVEHAEEPDATLYDHLGDIYSEMKQYQKAREAWQKSVEVEPNDPVKKKLESTPLKTAPPR